MTKYLLPLAILVFSCTEIEGTEDTAATCSDGADNDGDSALDCDDSGCATFCAPSVENCFGGADEDQDGLFDCNDPDCTDNDPANSLNESACVANEDCQNGVDDNGDDNIDCADAQCTSDPDCIAAFCGAPIPSEQDVLDDTNNGTDLTAGTNTGTVQKCELGVGGGKEMVYLFTPPNDGTLSLTLTSDTDQGIYVRTVCGDPNSEIACADEFISADETIAVAVSGGAPLFIFVDAFEDGAEGLYILTTLLQ
jgi:hypothetical protein